MCTPPKPKFVFAMDARCIRWCTRPSSRCCRNRVQALGLVRAPTLLIVGGEDRTVLALNREAAARLRCPHRLALVSGAGHLFEQPGALGTVAALSRDWFLQALLDRRGSPDPSAP